MLDRVSALPQRALPIGSGDGAIAGKAGPVRLHEFALERIFEGLRGRVANGLECAGRKHQAGEPCNSRPLPKGRAILRHSGGAWPVGCRFQTQAPTQLRHLVRIARQKRPRLERPKRDRKKIRQRPTLPHGFPRSTIGSGGLNFRVRDGNGWNPSDIATGMVEGATPSTRRRSTTKLKSLSAKKL